MNRLLARILGRYEVYVYEPDFSIRALVLRPPQEATYYYMRKEREGRLDKVFVADRMLDGSLRYL